MPFTAWKHTESNRQRDRKKFVMISWGLGIPAVQNNSLNDSTKHSLEPTYILCIQKALAIHFTIFPILCPCHNILTLLLFPINCFTKKWTGKSKRCKIKGFSFYILLISPWVCSKNDGRVILCVFKTS